MIKKAEKIDVPKLVCLYNQVTDKLIKRGIQQWCYPWTEQQIENILPMLFLLKKSERIIGSMSISEMENFHEVVTKVFSFEK
ncbi:hypothetical protein ACYSNR_02400 [Enterococcus sp. LJL128]